MHETIRPANPVLQGTGSVGATIRIYLEKYASPSQPDQLGQETADALAELIRLAHEVSQIKSLTGRDEPTVIT